MSANKPPVSESEKVGQQTLGPVATSLELAIFTFISVSRILQPWLALFPPLISLRLRGLDLTAVGLKRPASWIRTLAWSVYLGAGWAAFTLFVVPSLVQNLFGIEYGLTIFHKPQEYPQPLFFWLVTTWTVFLGEEIAYRGYLINRFGDTFDFLFMDRPVGWLAGLLFGAVLYGFANMRQGWIGAIDTGLLGLFLGVIYLLNGRNLWLPVLVHATGFTLAFMAVLSGRF